MPKCATRSSRWPGGTPPGTFASPFYGGSERHCGVEHRVDNGVMQAAGAAVVTGVRDRPFTRGTPSLRHGIVRECSVASRLRSLRSPLRGLDPACRAPEWSGNCRSDGTCVRAPTQGLEVAGQV